MNIRNRLYSLLLLIGGLSVCLVMVLDYCHRYNREIEQSKLTLLQFENRVFAMGALRRQLLRQVPVTPEPQLLLNQHIHASQQVLQQLEPLVDRSDSLAHLNALRQFLVSYQTDFLRLSQVVQRNQQDLAQLEAAFLAPPLPNLAVKAGSELELFWLSLQTELRRLLQQLRDNEHSADPLEFWLTPMQQLSSKLNSALVLSDRSLVPLSQALANLIRQWRQLIPTQLERFQTQQQQVSQLRQLEQDGLADLAELRRLIQQTTEQRQQELAWLEGWSIFGLLGLMLVFAYAIVRSVTERLTRLNNQIRQLAVANFDLQLDVRGQDEFERLGNTFFELSAKLLGSFEQLQWQQKELAHRHQQLQTSMSELEQTQLNLAHSETKYSQLFSASGDAILLLDDEFIIEANPACANLLGLVESAQLLLQPLMEFSPVLQAKGEDSVALFEQYRLQTRQMGLLRFEWLFRRVTGELFVAEVALVPCYIGTKPAFQATIRDISERKKHEQAIARANLELKQRVVERTQNLQQLNTKLQQEMVDRRRMEATLEQIAHFDELTGLANRSLLRDRLEQAMTRLQRHAGRLGLILMDLDRFKHINDSLGHDVGDLLLIEAARRVKGLLRLQQTGARLGGDEFAVLVLENASSEELAHLAGKILSGFSRPFMLDQQEVFVSASIGIACYPGDADSADGLLKAAEVAMYHAKEEGRHNYQFYSPELNLLAHEYLDMERRLRRAIETTQFELFYQPQINGKSGAIEGFEALIRWRDDSGQLVETLKFISFAEHLGLMIPMGNWVIYEACQQIRRWYDEGLGFLPVAVNFSAKQFRFKNLLSVIETAVRDAAIPPSALSIELTESTLMEDRQEVTALLSHLRSLGYRIAIDDFGTGYSSLAYLKHFPIDCLKIDRSFVRDLPDDPEDVAIVRTVIALAKNLGFKLVAEGVETLQQGRFLTEQGCDLMQGYLFAKPVAASEVPALCAKAVAGGFDLLRPWLESPPE